MRITITNYATGETIPISRSVTDRHPAWVHEQCGTRNESELQLCLDQFHVSDWYLDKDGRHLGPDICGIQFYHDSTI